MSIKTTTALSKIASLKKRIKVIQGGQGAGKTFSILMLIINHAHINSNKDIYIASQELSKMKITVIKDFLSIIKLMGIWEGNRWKYGREYYFNNGSKITFIGLDSEDIGKGLRSDIIFLNEANKTKFETYRELTSRADQVIIDFNPNKEFWVHTDVLDRDDAEFLKLTYKDNEYLSENEIKEIERYKTKAYINPDLSNPDKPENIKSKYWLNKWHVYGLGIVGTNPNRIFFWNRCTLKQYNDLDVPVYYGVDWGKVDPFGILEIKYHDGRLFLKELNYLSEDQIRERLTAQENTKLKQEDEGLVKWLFSKFKIDKNRPIICDSNRPEKIKALRQMGYGYAISAKKGKGSILSGVDILSGLEVFYTEESKNIEQEQMNYSNKVDRYGVVLEEPEDDNNHCFAGDTLIYTSKGLEPIKYVKKGDYVYTTNGLNKVLKKFDNGKKNILNISIQSDTFLLSLQCTSNHKIKTQRGWIKAIDLKKTDTIYLHKSLKEKFITNTKTKSILQKAQKNFIELFGLFIKEKYQKDMTFIIKTVIQKIIKLKTLTLSNLLYIKDIQENKDLKTIKNGLRSFIEKALKKLKNGTNQKRAKNGIQSKQKNNTIKTRALLSFVKPAIKNIKQKQLIKAHLDFAQTNVKANGDETLELITKTGNVNHAEKHLLPINIVKLNIVQGNAQKVYDLMIDKNHEYFANGILVHNCIDPTRYVAQFMLSEGIIKNI